MELFKKEYLISLNNKQYVIVPKSFLKILIIDNKNNITNETIREYLALDEINETKRFVYANHEFIRFILTQKGEYFVKTSRKVSNNEIIAYCAKNDITTYKEENIEYNSFAREI